MENNFWQVCPLCNGVGVVCGANGGSNVFEQCSVCCGKKIISTLTGFPPVPTQEISSLKG